MTYAAIDSILQGWSRKHGLSISTEYKDEEVRSVELTDQKGRRYQIWIDLPDERGSVAVHAWDYRKQRTDAKADIGDLETTLDNLRATVLNWMIVP